MTVLDFGVGPGSAEQLEETLHRVRDTTIKVIGRAQ
jgi:hypothetical protein